jgi:hypothetical protein
VRQVEKRGESRKPKLEEDEKFVAPAKVVIKASMLFELGEISQRS